MRFWRQTIVLMGLCLWFSAVPAAWASARVQDDAHMFSSSAVGQATAQLQQLSASTHKDFYVISVSSVAGTWQATAQRYVGRNINGVLIFIDFGHHKIYLAADNRTEEVLTAAREADIKNAMETEFRQKNFDAGLMAGVSNLSTTLAAASLPVAAPRYNAPPPAPASHGWGGLIGLLWIILFFWGVFAVIRWIARAVTGGGMVNNNFGGGGGGYPMGGPGYPVQQQGGGGGFWSSFLGGAGGAIAGEALFDRFGRRRDEVGPVDNSGFAGNSPATPDWQQQGTSTNWSDGGSSWDNSSSSSSSDTSSSWSSDSGSSWGGDSGSSGGGGSDWS